MKSTGNIRLRPASSNSTSPWVHATLPVRGEAIFVFVTKTLRKIHGKSMFHVWKKGKYVEICMENRWTSCFIALLNAIFMEVNSNKQLDIYCISLHSSGSGFWHRIVTTMWPEKKPWDIPQRGKHLAATSYGEISDPKKMETPKVMFHHFSSLFKSRSRLQLVNIGGTNQEFRTAFLELKGKTSDPFIFGYPPEIKHGWMVGWKNKIPFLAVLSGNSQRPAKGMNHPDWYQTSIFP